MIKKYESFLFEMAAVKKTEIDHYLSLYDRQRSSSGLIGINDKFATKIKALSEYFDEFFTNLASNHNLNVDDDFKEMQKVMDRTGFTIDFIKKLFSEDVLKITHEHFPWFVRKHKLDELNGYIDVYLYKISELINVIDNWRPDLGGRGWPETAFESPEEIFIKYEYGYHKTSYGRLLMNQLDITEDDFKDNLANNFWRFYLDWNLNASKIISIMEEEEVRLSIRKGNKVILLAYEFWSMFDDFIKQGWQGIKTYEDFLDNLSKFLENRNFKNIEVENIVVEFEI